MLTKAVLVFLTCPPSNTEPPFLTHTTRSPTCNSYLHISILFIFHCTASLFLTHTPTHTNTTHPSRSCHTPFISTVAAVFSTSPVLLPNILSVFLRASQEMSFIKLQSIHTLLQTHRHTHTHTEKKPKHPEETKWGQTSVQPETHTHTHFLREQYYCFNSAAPTTGHWNWEFQNQWEQCYQNTLHGTQNNAGYSCSRARNIIKPLIKVCRAAPIGTQRVLSQEADGETTRGE